ncbi:hypothetical protein [Streptomyces qinzhouensis]|uniref:Uncharacterized protein n=1 Tax=Streptomyces qinzhouensis TaxID=2599401 RepID=A0A5B8JR42_9ACTN|nr:hypothetical protein [Streptomyces qinzhouensis]QDY80223.1 hypothetical protein FQU76_31105 [Streptomyces qinzhouensis]
MPKLLRRLGRRDDIRTETTDAEAPRTLLEDLSHRYLLRSSTAAESAVRDLLRDLPADARRPVVVVDVPPDAAGNLGEELGALLGRLSDEEPLAVRLVLSGAAAPAGEAGPLAQRLADAWRVTLEAPDAAAVLTPGGLLYVSEPATPGGGWWRFVPDAAPEALGTRLPAPRWQRALARVPAGRIGDCVARPVPAGMLLSPADAAAPRPDDPAYAAATHPEKVSVLLGVPRAGPVPADDVATLLAGLPADARSAVRLVPADGREAVALAEDVCDLLGTELEVTLGLPLNGGGPAAESVRLLSTEGEFTWSPPLTSLKCFPARDDGSRPAARPAGWSLPGAPAGTGGEPASLRLASGARAVAVRSGLWMGHDPEPPREVGERPADARALRVTVDSACLTGRERDAHLKSLAALLADLDAPARAHAELATPADASPELVAHLRKFAVRAGLALAAATGTGTAPAPPTQAEASTPAVPATAGTATPPTAPTVTAAPVSTTGRVPGARPATASSPGPLPDTATVRAEAPPGVPLSGPVPGTASAVSVPEATAASSVAPVVAPAVPRTACAQRSAPSAPSTPAAPAGVGATATGPVQPSGARPAAVSTEPAPLDPPRTTVPAPAAATAPAVAPAHAPLRPAPTGLSGERDRAAFRELAAAIWEEHSGPVGQALIKLPALRGSGAAGASADLIAVRLYLSSGPDDPFGAHALAADPDRLRPYAVCLASGLRRLPALRGTLIRAVPQPAIPDDVIPGAVLMCDAPLDVVHAEARGAALPPDPLVRYVIRPVTARRTSVLSRDGDGAGALFAAGTSFTVLARRERGDGTPARVLLAETPAGGGPLREPSAEALEKLDTAARRPATGENPWPGRCTGPFLRYAPPVS